MPAALQEIANFLGAAASGQRPSSKRSQLVRIVGAASQIVVAGAAPTWVAGEDTILALVAERTPGGGSHIGGSKRHGKLPRLKATPSSCHMAV